MPRRARQPDQVELAEQLVVGGHLTLALEHADGHRGLVSSRREVWLFLVGIVVLRSISRVNTPPSVSMPSDSGVTSSKEDVLDPRASTPPWIAAPRPRPHPGWTAAIRLLAKICFTVSMTLGMRVMPRPG